MRLGSIDPPWDDINNFTNIQMVISRILLYFGLIYEILFYQAIYVILD